MTELFSKATDQNLKMTVYSGYLSGVILLPISTFITSFAPTIGLFFCTINFLLFWLAYHSSKEIKRRKFAKKPTKTGATSTTHSMEKELKQKRNHELNEFENILNSIPDYEIFTTTRVYKKRRIDTMPQIKVNTISKKDSSSSLSSFVVIDIETTGLSHSDSEIIEIGAIKFENSIPVSKFSTLIKPKKRIPSKITELTGIDEYMVEDAPYINEVLDCLEKYLKGYPIVGHNVVFDVGFLIRYNLMLEQETPLYDSLQIARTIYKTKESDCPIENHKLNTLI